MSYFKPFPNVSYNGVTMPKITASTVIEGYGRDSFIEYTIEDGETPEMLAHRIYGNSEYAAFILQMNNIVDVYNEWPLNEKTLYDFASMKYDNIYGIHHYENTAGNVVSDNYPENDRYPVTNIEYEQNVNEMKRQIRLLHPSLMTFYVEEHRRLMEGSDV